METLDGLLGDLLIEYRQMVSSRLLMKTYLERAEALPGVKDQWVSVLGQQLMNQKVCSN